MKFLVPNYSCLQNPWLGGCRLQIPILSVLNWICWTPPRTKFLGTPLFLLVVGWWLSWSCRYFLLQWESQVQFTLVKYAVISRLPEWNFVGHWARHSYNKKNRDCAGKPAYNGIPSRRVNEYQPVAKYQQMTINPTAPSVRLKTTKSLRKQAAAKAVPCKQS